MDMHGDPNCQTIGREVLDRYLAGESSAEEISAVGAWLATHPDGVARLDRPAIMSREAVETDWKGIATRIGDLALGTEGRVRDGRHPFGRRLIGWQSRRVQWRYAIMGVVLGALTIVAGWQVGVSHFGRHGPLNKPTYYATGNGERANITLPDGSTVILNVASRLAVPADYAAGNHTVHLRGEALFTVSRHDRTPFTVLAGSTAARVLGTSFVVRHYDADTSAIVAVHDGKVAVGTAVVTANNLLEVGSNGVPHIRRSDSSPFTFATGTLTLTSMPLLAGIVELDRWYDADIRLGDSTLAARHIEGEFAAGSLAELAAILELTFNVHVVRDGRVLTLFPRR